MSEHKPKAVRPDHIEPDPRTDDVDDDGALELDPPSAEEIVAGLEHDRAHREANL